MNSGIISKLRMECKSNLIFKFHSHNLILMNIERFYSCLCTWDIRSSDKHFRIICDWTNILFCNKACKLTSKGIAFYTYWQCCKMTLWRVIYILCKQNQSGAGCKGIWPYTVQYWWMWKGNLHEYLFKDSDSYYPYQLYGPADWTCQSFLSWIIVLLLHGIKFRTVHSFSVYKQRLFWKAYQQNAPLLHAKTQRGNWTTEQEFT